MSSIYTPQRMIYNGMHSLVLMVMLFVFSAFPNIAKAQDNPKAFYIYQNDGHFDAFFYDEVEKITYSRLDTLGQEYDVYVSQEIVTADSTYRIMLTAIDSVGFVQPETKFQPNVVNMNQKGLMDYLLSVDGMSLFFNSKIPGNLQPKVGDVLLDTDFEHPLLSEGFVGKVQKTQMTTGAFRVDCDSIYDIFEIFEQLISIEKLEDTKPTTRNKIKDEWISSRNPINFDLGFEHSLSKGDLSVYGSINGTYIATVAYNISLGEQYINLKVNHDWQYGAHLKFKAEKSFGTLFGHVAELPAIRFPVAAPIFKFQISGVPFVKGEGDMELDLSLNSPVHSYVTQATYRNGHFSGSNHKVSQSSKSLNFETVFSINGNVHAGYMVDFWLGIDFGIKGFAKDLLKLGTGLDFYIGPKISGDFSIKAGTENPVNFYSLFKDTKVGISLLTIDYEFFGEASLAGHKFPKSMFCEGSIQTPLYWEWYLFPEFSDLTINKDKEKKEATILTTPTRDILCPLNVGIGLYDSEGSFLSSKYETNKYKNENKGFQIKQTFPSLERTKEYTAKPFIKLLGLEIPALPVETFKLEEDIPVEISNFEMNKASYYPNHYPYNNKMYSFKYNCTAYVTLKDNTNVVDWGYVYIDPEGNISDPISLQQYSGTVGDPRYSYCRNEATSTVKLKGYVKYKDDDEIYYGKEQEFPIEYPAESSVTMTNCTFQGTTSNVSYQGKTYKYKSTYRYLFTATGGYWLKVGTDEKGSGWNNWSDLPNYTTSPVDGANALTVNYYYDDKTFSGDYNVYLKATDATHSVTHTTTEYVTYTHSNKQFTGCNFHSGSPEAKSGKNHVKDYTNEKEFDIVINKTIY